MFDDAAGEGEKSFKEILNMMSKSTSKNNTLKNEKIEEVVHRKSSQDRINGAVSRLASFFRIGINLMMEMLKSLGIKPEDLIDETKRNFSHGKLPVFIIGDFFVRNLSFL